MAVQLSVQLSVQLLIVNIYIFFSLLSVEFSLLFTNHYTINRMLNSASAFCCTCN